MLRDHDRRNLFSYVNACWAGFPKTTDWIVQTVDTKENGFN